MATPILAIPELVNGQVDQYLTANEAFRFLEAAENDFHLADLSAGNVTLTAAEYSQHVLFRSSGNTVARDLTLQAVKRLVVVQNAGTAILSVKLGSTAIDLAPGASRLLLTDGTTDGLISIGGGAQQIWIPASEMIARTTAGAAAGTVETTTNQVMLSTLDFDAATDEFAQLSFVAPKRWDLGTVTAEFVWSHAATVTNFDVIWAIQGVALSDGEAADTAFGTAVSVTDTGGTTDDVYRSSVTAAVTIAGTPAANDLVVMQVYRDADDAADNLAVDARLHGVMLTLNMLADTDD